MPDKAVQNVTADADADVVILHGIEDGDFILFTKKNGAIHSFARASSLEEMQEILTEEVRRAR